MPPSRAWCQGCTGSFCSQVRCAKVAGGRLTATWLKDVCPMPCAVCRLSSVECRVSNGVSIPAPRLPL